MQGLGFLAKSFLAVSDRKITDLAWGKKVRGVFPDRLISKKCSFIWKFTRRTLKTEYFFPVFEFFDPLDFEIGVKKCTRNADFQHTVLRYSLKTCFFGVVFSRSPFWWPRTGKSQNQLGEKEFGGSAKSPYKQKLQFYM